MKLLLTLVLSCLYFYSFGQEIEWVVRPSLEFDHVWKFKEGMSLVQKNNKFGFVDSMGKIVIPLEYDYAKNFSEGLAMVQKNGKSGFINQTGKIIIPLEYNYANNFSEGLAGVQKDKNVGFINKDGKIIIPLEFDGAGDFSEGLVEANKGFRVYFLDKTGKTILTLPNNICMARGFSDGLALVGTQIPQFGFINKFGKIIIPLKGHFNCNSFLEGLAIYGDWDNTRGYINKEGEKIAHGRFTKLENFSEGLALVCNYPKYGYINPAGKISLPIEYDNAACFSEGLAWVQKDKQEFFIDKTGKTIITLPLGKDRPYYPDLERPCFSEGLAWVKKDGKWGIIKNPLKNEPIPVTPEPKPTIAKAVITWISPSQEETISTESNQTLKACISSATRPSQIQLLLNGKPYSPKDFVIEPANSTNCDYSYELNLNITTKNEPLNFVLSVTNE